MRTIDLARTVIVGDFSGSAHHGLSLCANPDVSERRAADTVIVVDHDMSLAAGSDWVIDIGPGAGEDGAQVMASGPPSEVAAKATRSRTAPYLKRALAS